MINTLSKLPFWTHLTNNEKEYALSNAALKHYEKGELIHGCNDSCLGMMYIIKGNLRAYIISEEGREITLFRLKENNTCVLSADCVIKQITFDTQIEAVDACDVLIINSGAFMKLAEKNIYVKCFMYELISERFSAVMWTMQQILFAKLDRRLAEFLIHQYEETKCKEIHMTQEQIANRINSAREVVARMLKQFTNDGLVEIKRGCIVLKDINALKNI